MTGGHAWQESKCGRGHEWQVGMQGGGACMVGACMAVKSATEASGTHPTRMHFCLVCL